MKFINHSPQLISKGQWGVWRVTATHQDGSTHSVDYEVFTRAEAIRRYLMEFGKVRGEIYVEIIQKTS